MKGATYSLCLGLLAAIPAQGFVAPSSSSQLRLRLNSSHGSKLRSRHSQATSTAHQRTWSQPRTPRSLATMKTDIPKTLATVLIVGSTIFASAIPLLTAGSESNKAKTVRVVDEDGTVSERGALTSMTRSEIQKKLAQVPIFFLKDEGGAVHIEGGEGLFFMSPGDAKAKLQELKEGDRIKVAATTLDDVWFPLIKKKGPNKKPRAAEASNSSDLSARYKLVPRSNQLSQAVETEGWNAVGDKDGVPVWAANTLAFKGRGSSMKFPIFTNVDDLMTSWERLKTEAGSETTSPNIQVSSIGAIIDIMEGGGGGGGNRNLEFFADMDSIEEAEELLL